MYNKYNMNNTNDFISTLLNNREKIVDKLLQNFSYDHLLKIFGDLNNHTDPQFSIQPDDGKFLYHLLTGNYNGSKYDKSSIDWLPSSELVEGIINLAKNLNIKHIEEIYSGTGILSSLLSNNSNGIEITTADTFSNIETCNKLANIPIAKRCPSDYKYYPQFGEEYPEMVISSFFPNNTFDDYKNTNNFLDEISALVQSNNHKIIVVILPHTFVKAYDIFYHCAALANYNYNSYHIKALDKYFFVWNLLQNFYLSPMVAHILVKNEIKYLDRQSMSKLFEPAIITDNVNTYCYLAKILRNFYDLFSPKLVKNVYRSLDFTKSLPTDSKVVKVLNEFVSLNKKKYIVPSYIYEIDELLFWSKCIDQGLYFIFDKRMDFYTFYTQSISIQNSELRRQIDFPKWITNIKKMYQYIYLDVTRNNDNKWRKSQSEFLKTFNDINAKNSLLVQRN